MFDLTGKRALVTGAGQSVGAGIARALAEQGAEVVVNDIVGERASAVVDEIAASGGSAVAAVFDVTDLAAVEGALAGVDLDIVVNNAGNAGAERMNPTPFVDMTVAQWEAPIRINLYGVLNTTKAVLSDMIDRGWGRIITISSGAGSTGIPIGVSTYGAGKGGAQAFMRMVASENARHGITANSVALGLMDNATSSEVTAAMARTVPVGRVGLPSDIGPIVVYLASDEAAWTTGQTIHVNGGNLMT